MKNILLTTVLSFLCIGILQAQNLVWTGKTDKDFFTVDNWQIEGSESSPAAGSLSMPINFNLKISNDALILPGSTPLSFASGRALTLDNAKVEMQGLSGGTIKLLNRATLILNAQDPIAAAAKIELEDNTSWIKLPNVDPVVVNATYLARITSKGANLTTDQNVHVNQYYYQGSLVRLKDANKAALTLYDGKGQTGSTFEASPLTVYGRNELGAFENKASSFRLERGYQVTVAIYQNGTGKSENYIAIEEDLLLDLPAALDNTISFVRVVPWNWVTKKGASKFNEVGNTWTYNWNNTGESLPNIEYVPMSWGAGGATVAAATSYRNKQNVTHILGFNESDNCNDQSGQFNNLCQVPVAVPLFENLMRSGLRLVSPSPRENGPFGWLRNFRDLAVEKDVRYDVLGVHWYDWGSNPVNSPFEDPQKIFDRFKTYLNNVYNTHKMPIWLTEFNANPNRDLSVHRAFLELALPYLESLDFVERYDYFEPMKEISSQGDNIEYPRFFDDAGNITPFGTFYKEFKSTASIKGGSYAGSALLSGLNKKVQLKMEINKTKVAAGESIIIKFTTDRPVGAPEEFKISLNMTDKQYILQNSTIQIPEGGTTAEATLVTVEGEFDVEEFLATISLTILSSGIEWVGSTVQFTIESELPEEVVLAVQDDGTVYSLYPNPSPRYLNIDTSVGIRSIEVMDLTGNKMPTMTLSDNRLDMLNYKQGVYIVKVNLLNGHQKTNLIIKN